MRPPPACWICLHSVPFPLLSLLSFYSFLPSWQWGHVKFMQTNSHAKWGLEDKCIAPGAPWIRTVLRMVTTSCSFKWGSIECGRDWHVPAVGSRHTHFSCSLEEYMYVFACGRTRNSATRCGACKALDCVWNIDKGLFEAHMYEYPQFMPWQRVYL